MQLLHAISEQVLVIGWHLSDTTEAAILRVKIIITLFTGSMIIGNYLREPCAPAVLLQRQPLATSTNRQHGPCEDLYHASPLQAHDSQEAMSAEIVDLCGNSPVAGTSAYSLRQYLLTRLASLQSVPCPSKAVA